MNEINKWTKFGGRSKQPIKVKKNEKKKEMAHNPDDQDNRKISQQS